MLCGQRARRAKACCRRGQSVSHSAIARKMKIKAPSRISGSWAVVVLPSIARAASSAGIFSRVQLMSYSSDLLNTTLGSQLMSTQNPKRELFQQLARVGTALSSGTRLEFLELLAQGERSVDQLAAMTGATVANTSQHLQKLRQAGLIAGRKQGLYVFYRLAGDEVVGLLPALGHVGETYLAEVERIVRLYLAQKDNLEPVPARELLARARRGLVTVLDVRPSEEYAAGHLPGAVNIPIHELEKRLKELPKRREIVAYCRGPYCLMSYDAVALLRKRGIKARRLEAGLPEWRLAGLPVERH